MHSTVTVFALNFSILCKFSYFCNVVSTLEKVKHIRFWAAWVLLVVFALGVTPKPLLHELFVAHIEAGTADLMHHEHGKQTTVCNAPVSCECNNIEPLAPFTDLPVSKVLRITTPENAAPVHFAVRIHSAPHNYFSLRGPPRLA